MDDQSEKILGAVKEVLKKSLSNEKIREMCLNSPLAVVLDCMDTKIPEDFTIRFVEDMDDAVKEMFVESSLDMKETGDAFKQILTIASIDRKFRRQCLEDPELVLGKSIKTDLPDDMAAKFKEKIRENIFQLPPGYDRELNEEELEKVAGGTDNPCN